MSEAIEKWREYLRKPEIGPEDGGQFHDGVFSPWEWFPSIYGSYSSEFDEVAMTVLQNMLARKSGGETVAHEMFREMLCASDIAEYGTSPRTCFFDHRIERHEIEEWVRKWNHYSTVMWGADWQDRTHG